MEDRILRLDRRELLAGLGAAVLAPAMASTAGAQGRPSLTLQAKAGVIALRPGGPDTPIWSLQGPAQDTDFRFKRGDALEISLANGLPVPALLNWYGLDGVPAAEPLAPRPSLAPGAMETSLIPLRHAGTLMCDLRLLGDGQARPCQARALIVAESEAVAVDRDEVFLIEDWRLRPDGGAIAPGADAKDTATHYTINGRPAADINIRANERLRLRLINGCRRNAIALKIEDHDVLVVAIDGQPAEPFPARNGALVLAPGSRIDAFIDGTRPAGSVSPIVLHDGKAPHTIGRLVTSGDAPARNAPLPPAKALASNGLPPQLDLKNALRFELALGGAGGSQPDWVPPANLTATVAPTFRVKAGRVVVLALTNRASTPSVFHLHGHHFRLLDRLDDGWKPFWLDTLMIDAGQTQRVAFAAETKGRWLMETMATDWAAPRLVRCYAVE